MTNKQIIFAFSEAPNYSDPEAFASDMLLSSDFSAGDGAAAPELTLLPELEKIWHVANDRFKDYLNLLGLTQTKCARRFGIPLRTVQGWALEQRSPQPYVRLMMAEIIGVIKSNG